MRKYVEAFLRHKILLTLPIVLALAVSMGLTLRQPKQWVASATFWTDSSVPNESTVLSRPDPTPAEQTASLLQELLHTKDFLSKVASRESSAAFLEGRTAPFDDIALGEVAGSISLSSPGPQVLSVSVTGTDPKAAAGLAESVVVEFQSRVTETVKERNQELVDFQQQRLDSAAKTLDAAQGQLSGYLTEHPQTPGQQDAVATQLESNVVAAQDAYSKAQASVNDAELALSVGTSPSSLRVIDEPTPPALPQSRRMAIIFGGVGGLVAGGLVTLLLLLFFVSTDATARSSSDLEDGLGVRVVGSIEQLRGMRRLRKQAS
jgi:uncharacterized protein involved in exopolysaccharide biosynthesis